MARQLRWRSERGPSPSTRGAGEGLSAFVRRALLGAFAAAVLSAAGGAWADPARLSLSGAVLFSDADPDLVPVLASPVVVLGVDVVGVVGTQWSLTLIANSDLVSGPNVIPISSVSWTATPNPPFRDGQLSALVPTLVATGFASHSRFVAQFNFTMPNSWNYVPGNYAATATFTLTSP